MTFTGAEKRAEYAYIEQSIEDALCALQDPSVRQYIGSKVVKFETTLSNVVIANKHDGLVSLPTDYDFDTPALPIVLYDKREPMRLSSVFNTQTPLQKIHTIEAFEQWESHYKSAQELYEVYAANPSTTEQAVIFQSQTVGLTGTNANVLTPRTQLHYFSKPPFNGHGLIFFRNRPILILCYKPGVPVAADIIVHESSHYLQTQQKPTVALHSQRSATMYALREELEAYHDGFPVAQKVVDSDEPADASNIHSHVQYAVEGRRILNPLLDQSDPFKPSGLLWNQLQQDSLGGILHLAIDYDATVSDLRLAGQL